MRRTILIAPVAVLLAVAAPADDFNGLLGVQWQGEVYRLDVTTGAKTLLHDNDSAQVGTFNSLARTPDGTYWTHSTQGRLYRIDAGTGVATQGRPTPGITDIRALAGMPDGRLLAMVAANFDRDLYAITPGSGLIQHVTAIATGITGLAYAPDGRLLGTHVTHGVVEIEPTTGAYTDLYPNDDSVLFGFQSLAFGPGGALYAAYNGLWRIDQTDGSLTRLDLPGTINDIRGIEWVPEPATSLLLLGAAFTLRRR